jgi:hypothetical protein
MWLGYHAIRDAAVIVDGLVDDGELKLAVIVPRSELEILFHWFGFEEESTSVLLGVQYGFIPSLRDREGAAEVSNRKW